MDNLFNLLIRLYSHSNVTTDVRNENGNSRKKLSPFEKSSYIKLLFLKGIKKSFDHFLAKLLD